MSKPEKPPLTFYGADWVELTEAFLRIRSHTRRPDVALHCINRDLRNGSLTAALVKISPDGNEMVVTPLDPSEWQQRTVHAPLNPEEGVRVEPPYEDGYVYVRAVDLDKHYQSATTAAPQSDDTESSPPTPPGPEKQKPGVKPGKDWPNRLLAPEIVRVAYETPDLLLDRTQLVRHVRNFLKDQMDWEPFDNKPIHRELNRLLSRIR